VSIESVGTPGPIPVHGDLTQLLIRWQGGDQRARDQLTAAIYQQLKAIAKRRLSEQARYIVDPTELVNEVLIKLIQSPSGAEDREQLFKIAASAVRYTLLDLVRRRDAEKRGHGETTSLDTIGVTFVENQARLTIDDWIDAEHALVELERLDPRKCRIAELAFIIGLEQVEISDVMRLSLSTVERELRFCRSWLRARLNPTNAEPG
jgi:RNA polymerase sigma factor (TIGR02999 family)